jgi:hypothetical protein
MPRDGRNKTKHHSQDEDDNSCPKCSPLKLVAPVEPPLLHGLRPGGVVRLLHPAKAFLPIRVVAQIKYFVGSYGGFDGSLDIYVVFLANSTCSFRCLKVRWREQERQRPFCLG